MQEVAVVGLGAMGSRMVRRLLSKGFAVTTWNRSPGPTELLGALGVSAATVPAEAAALKDCQHIAVVGDNIASDIAGAKRAGLEAILVLTGIATEEDLGRYRTQPDRVFASLAALGAELAGPGCS